MGDVSEVDVLVIGAGISGISAAKFWLDTHPNSQLVILDRDNCLGGTWNSRRGYDTFWTQWTVGTAEFSDQPMPRPPDEDIYLEFFKAKHTTKYLNDYVDSHSYSGWTLRDRVRLSTEVQSVQKIDGGWTVVSKERESPQQHTFQTAKLIVASGLTSIPNMPLLPGRDGFLGQVLHQDSFGSSNVLTSPEVKNITVLGGGKSSADMVYESVKAGKTVSWGLKATDTAGPGFFLSPKGAGPYKNAFEIGMTRLAATFTPSFMNGINWWTRLLHSSRCGLRLMAGFWESVDAKARAEADYQRKSLKDFDKLSPHSPIFWQNCTGGLLNHRDFFDTIAENVRIYVGDIDCLDKNSLRLKSGDQIPTDALLCGTGWQPSLQFFSKDQCRQLGLPHLVDDESPDEKSHWAALEADADAKVLATFPQLADPPAVFLKPATKTPYRLYRHLVPLCESCNASKDRSIVFIGQVGVGNYFPLVECQSIWATAYLDGKLDLPSTEEQEKDVALFTTWCRRRYLSNGLRGNAMTFELIGYTDTLLKDLGLRSNRKGWFKDIFFPIWAKDFGGLKAEFMEKYY
ncbi:dimethylaniline monooxygenase, putative [Talaromyces stipitatus ATCC 10500]|uniref:Dimethylaniline monooxygenase, putative n=1 Tax=Talaromyces stipitatus (strain ATCC 10500 / CBS 375.48 / QM 6759 / NRRL 1006) TaxID=441959 RepID=B8LWT8_TALSN|nr:dimethylaniline monooxygenase, putative [Talaromyces stipitatus ATCC 10500]EED24571.1 dimethylaniline monooxygenase, putative [Talaromyces stipitatus ATCC 10500]